MKVLPMQRDCYGRQLDALGAGNWPHSRLSTSAAQPQASITILGDAHAMTASLSFSWLHLPPVYAMMNGC